MADGSSERQHRGSAWPARGTRRCRRWRARHARPRRAGPVVRDRSERGAPGRRSHQHGAGAIRAARRAGAGDPMRDFVAVVLADTEDTWKELFRAMNRQYEEPTLVLFTGAVQSACGFAQAAMGPFYCPPDRKVFIDLSFYQSLQDRLGAPGDF